MQNYAKALEIINLQSEISRREFYTAVNSPFGFPVAPAANSTSSDWQPLLDYPEMPPIEKKG
jgi:hypothetical protein